MGKKALRKELKNVLKSKGLSSRFYRGCKLSAYRQLTAGHIRHLIFLLRMQKGEVYNDCDFYNHRVKAPPNLKEFRFSYGLRTSILFYNGRIEWEDGLNCGCPCSPEPALSRVDILRNLNCDPSEIDADGLKVISKV